MAFDHSDHNSHSVLHFVNLSQTGWITSSMRTDFTSYGNIIVGHTTIIVGIHNSTESLVEKFLFKTPPSKLSLLLNSFLWQNFNKVGYGISYGHEEDNFRKELYTGFNASLPSNLISITIADGVKLYFLHAVGSDTSILADAWLSHGTACAPPSPVHLTVTSSNPTLCWIPCQQQTIRPLILPIWVHFLLPFHG